MDFDAFLLEKEQLSRNEDQNETSFEAEYFCLASKSVEWTKIVPPRLSTISMSKNKLLVEDEAKFLKKAEFYKLIAKSIEACPIEAEKLNLNKLRVLKAKIDELVVKIATAKNLTAELIDIKTITAEDLRLAWVQE